MTDLADEVLPLIRTRAELWRRRASQHGRQMDHAVDILEAAAGVADAKEVYNVTTRAIASACSVISRADDSDGVMGTACRRLIDLHPRAAAIARPDPRRLVDWMIKFQFHGVVDYFDIDVAAYAEALGETGVRLYREALAEIAGGLGDEPAPTDRWRSAHSHEWWVIQYNRQRLAVLDKDVEAIIATHWCGGRVAAQYEAVAKALAEIGEFDLAIDWARRGAMEGPGPGFQAAQCAGLWRSLVADHNPGQALDVGVQVFARWPTAENATVLRDAAEDRWPEYRDGVMAALSTDARQAVIFAMGGLKDVDLAWELAHELGLGDGRLWSDLAKQYERIDPLATLSVHRQLVEGALGEADATQYRLAARRLVTMRRLAAGTAKADQIDAYIAELRETHRRRPRLQREFDKAGLP